ncbi:MAG: tetratricopeptide repeat protein [Bacteroidales bacterium]
MENILTIEELIDGNLSDKDAEKFKAEVLSNDDINAEYEFRKEINMAIRDKHFSELRAKLQNQFKEDSRKLSRVSPQKDLLKTWHLATASFSLILVVGGLWYILSNKPYSSERLISKYYKPAQPILQVRSMEFTGDDVLKEAFNLYQQNNYENALKYFNSLDNQIIAKFYSGICYIELGQFSKAVESFEFVINDADNLFVEQAEWYLGLIFLMNNQKSAALEQFARISASESYYADQAKEIIRYIN